MAEGGGFENPAYDPDPFNEQHDDNDDDNQNLNETAPFISGSASTPAPYGDKILMQTSSHEQSRLPEASYTETSFGGITQSMGGKAWSSAKELFPDMKSISLDVFYDPKGKLQVKMSGSGKKAYNLMTEKGQRGLGILQINPGLSKEIKKLMHLVSPYMNQRAPMADSWIKY